MNGGVLEKVFIAGVAARSHFEPSAAFVRRAQHLSSMSSGAGTEMQELRQEVQALRQDVLEECEKRAMGQQHAMSILTAMHEQFEHDKLMRIATQTQLDDFLSATSQIAHQAQSGVKRVQAELQAIANKCSRSPSKDDMFREALPHSGGISEHSSHIVSGRRRASTEHTMSTHHPIHENAHVQELHKNVNTIHAKLEGMSAEIFKLKHISVDNSKECTLEDHPNTSSEDCKNEAVVSPAGLGECIQLALDAVRQEREQRTSTCSILQKELTNFQYGFSTERKERGHLRAEFIAFKQETSAQMNDLSERFAAVSRECREFTALERQSQLPVAEDPSLTKEFISKDDFDRQSNSVQESIQELRTLIQDYASREELGIETARLWATVHTDNFPRSEFEHHSQMIWNAIMQLQSSQLDTMKQHDQGTLAGLSKKRNSVPKTILRTGSSSPPAQPLSNSVLQQSPSGVITPRLALQTQHSSPSKIHMGLESSSPPVHHQQGYLRDATVRTDPFHSEPALSSRCQQTASAHRKQPLSAPAIS